MSNLRPNLKLFHEPVYTGVDGIVIRGKDLGDLISKITAYRSRNNLPAGNPEEEVYDQLCQRRPDKCREPAKGKFPRPAVSLNKRILAWVVGLVERRKRLNFVGEQEKRRREAICASCPAQEAWRGRCKGCTASVDDAMTEVLSKRPVGETLGCRFLGEDTRISVWLDEKTVENAQLPEHCWRRT